MRIKSFLSLAALTGAMTLLGGCAVEDRRGPDVVTVPSGPPPVVVERDRGPDVTVVNPPSPPPVRSETKIEKYDPPTTTTTTTTGGN
jgi:hypothetical protein